MIEWCLANGHGYWCGARVPWLFPARKGGHLDPHFLSAQVARRARQYVRAPITGHHFRHLCAELYLQEGPNPGSGSSAGISATGSSTRRGSTMRGNRLGSRASSTIGCSPGGGQVPGLRIIDQDLWDLGAELFLRTDPGGIAIVAQHLGHRDLDTTRRFYAREQTRIATERYHAVLIRERAAVPTRRRRSRKAVEGGA
jgi:integrase